jgi:hypothetical protein
MMLLREIVVIGLGDYRCGEIQGDVHACKLKPSVATAKRWVSRMTASQPSTVLSLPFTVLILVDTVRDLQYRLSDLSPLPLDLGIAMAINKPRYCTRPSHDRTVII